MTPKMAAVMATASLEQGAQGGAQRPGELKNKYLGTFAQRVAANISAKTDAAMALLKRPTSRKQQDGARQPQDQSVSETSQLRGQLTASEENRQRLQHKYDALSTSHDALSSRCSQLERQLQATQAAEASSSAKAAAANQQLETMRQQLKDANRSLDQQQKINKQQAAQLRKALSSLEGGKWKTGNAMAAAAATQQQLQQALGAKDREVKALSEQVAQLSAACRDNKKNLAAAEAEGAAVKQHLAALQQRYAQLQAKYDWVETESAAAVEGYRTEQRKMKLQLADMAAAVSAAEAAARRVQRDEAALLQAMAHLSQQYGDDHQQLQVVRERLTAAEASVSEKQGLLYLLDQAMTEQREILLDRVYAAETRADRAQNKVLEAKLKFDDLMRRLKADFIKFNDECLAKVQQARQQAAADKAALSEQVAQLQHRLEQQDLSCDGSITLQPVSGVEPVTTVEPVSGKRSGKGLRWLLQAVRIK